MNERSEPVKSQDFYIQLSAYLHTAEDEAYLQGWMARYLKAQTLMKSLRDEMELKLMERKVSFPLRSAQYISPDNKADESGVPKVHKGRLNTTSAIIVSLKSALQQKLAEEAVVKDNLLSGAQTEEEKVAIDAEYKLIVAEILNRYSRDVSVAIANSKK